MPSPPDAPRQSLWQNLLLSLGSLLFLFLVLAAIEGVLRWRSEDDDAYIHLAGSTSVLRREVVDGVEKVELVHPEMYGAHRLSFPAEKGPGVLRIFSYGGSASAGWPLPLPEAYTGWLQRGLAARFPSPRFEILNLGAHGYASYRVLRIFEQTIDLDPDWVIVLSGNNEFLEDRSYWRSSFLTELGRRSLLVRKLLEWRQPRVTLDGKRLGRLEAEAANRMRQIAKGLRADPEQLAQVRHHYRTSVERMLTAAGERGIPVLLLTLPTNLRDWHPNVSGHRAEGEALARWQRLFDRGRAALLRAEPAIAIDAFEEALLVDPHHAETHFLLGHALEAAGEESRAIEAYRRAKDEDLNPFRTLSSFNDVLRELAAEYDHVTLLDLDVLISRGQAPGFDLFVDAVHFTPEGNLRIAREVFAALLDAGLLGERGIGERFPESVTLKMARVRPEWDYRTQSTLARLFLHLHQHRALLERIPLVIELGEAKSRPPAELEEWRQLQEILATYLEEERNRLLGEPYDPAYREPLARYYEERIERMRTPASHASGSSG